MPELPEVQTVREVLKKQILGRRIENIDVYYEKMIKDDNALDFKNKLAGHTFTDILRKGKFLIFVLNDDLYLISHLRMEGKFFIKERNEEKAKHEHVIFHLDNGFDLRYHDTRKFGIMCLRNKDNLFSQAPLSNLASDANLIGFEEFKKNINGVNRPIKEVLLEQDKIAGIGNIYADEILFKSMINPLKPASLLDEKDIKNIIKYSKIILEEAILAGGTTIRSYTSSLGVTGRFQQQLYVHTKEGEACLNCGEVIKRIKVGGRSTYFCPNCQK